MKNKYIIILLLIISTFIFLLNCQITPIASKAATKNSFVYYTMKDLYLWYDKIPDVNYESYSTPEALLDALMYKQHDKWSYIANVVENTHYLMDGQYWGYGFSAKWCNENTTDWVLRLAFVYNSSPAHSAGLGRGYKIIKVNSIYIGDSTTDNSVTDALLQSISNELNNNETISISVKDLSNVQHDLVINKGTVTIDTILYSNEYTKGSYQIGYLVFNSFSYDATIDLDSKFKDFNNHGVNELILDMRYNPGGELLIAQYLADLIAGKNNDGEVFMKIVGNDRRLVNYANYYFQRLTNSMNLSRIFIITTSGSASASEAVINGLKPHMQVILIGSKTHGKPVGMSTIIFEDIALVPIMFKGYNSMGVGDFFNGIDVDCQANDDLRVAFGDESNDPCMAEAIYYIQNGGVFKGKSIGNEIIRGSKDLPMKGFRQAIGAF